MNLMQCGSHSVCGDQRLQLDVGFQCRYGLSLFQAFQVPETQWATFAFFFTVPGPATSSRTHE